jgi:hypothetical protein
VSPPAEASLEKIRALFAIEEKIAGQGPHARLAIRQRETVPRLAELNTLLEATLRRVSRKG